RIRDGELSDAEIAKAVEAMAELAEYPILIDDSPSLTVLELRGKARRMHLEHTSGLLSVDYLQPMSAATNRDNRVQEITEITRSLKSLARELNIPVVACAQLSRAVEQRPNPTPRLSDLRESGSIEQDADVVVFLHEPERDDEVIGKPVDLRLTIAKQRSGPVGELNLRFIRSLGRFEEVAEQSL
ncbi:MAG: DnaB-like helicase C-terminal domain-containing protein, partial [Chloroflexi bacterium]|nr:DnaB-like helicase C-terminal domain-containing protein [Chloroflexota bacterium]